MKWRRNRQNDRAFRSQHNGERQSLFAAVGQYRLLDELGGHVSRGKFEIRRERYHQIMRLNSFGPIRQETADFVEGFLGRNTGFHPVTPLGEPGRGFGPEHQQGINPQRGGEPIIARKAFLPYRALQVVER